MHPVSPSSAVSQETWRAVFQALASADQGHLTQWTGPQDVDELMLRVECLLILLGILPRSERRRLPEVVQLLAGLVRLGQLPDVARWRSEARRFLGLLDAAPVADQDLMRIRALLSGGESPRDVAVEASRPKATGLHSGEQINQCAMGLFAWQNQVLRPDGRWSRIRLLDADDRYVPIDEVYVDVLAVPDDEIEVGDAADYGRKRAVTPSLQRVAMSARAMMERVHRMCIVIGDPGSGKSTLAQWFTRQVTKRAISDYDVALHVKLSDFASHVAGHPNTSLVEFFFDSIGTKMNDWSEASVVLRRSALHGAKCLLILDGWDEVPANLRDRVQRSIELECGYFTVLLTSRPSGFPRRFRSLGPCDVFQIAGLTPQTQLRLAERYLQAIDQWAKLPRLIADLEANSELRSFCVNPFLLSLVARAVADAVQTKDWTLSDLYRWAIEMMLAQATTSSQEAGFHLVKAVAGLERLADHLLFEEANARYVFSSEELSRFAPLNEFLAILQSRFVNQVDKLGLQWTFLHATLQEFMAACRLVSMTPELQSQRIDKAFHSASRLIVLELLVGQSESTAEHLLRRCKHWLDHADRFGVVVLRVARLAVAASTRRIPTGLLERIKICGR
jgi:NACHT domain